jgi:hypothetical protein
MIRLEWVDAARDEWANIYVAAGQTEREMMADEMERLLDRLKQDPLEVGESKAPFLRVAIGGPLVVWFKVSPEATAARIVRVTRSAPPK